MTFKHKLSKRLAISWALLALACTPGDMTAPAGAPSLAVTAPQVLLQESFEDASFASRGWYDVPAMATTTAQHTANSTRAMEVHFTAGANTPTWGTAARHLFTATPTLYVSYWVKYSSNWVGSNLPYHPHEFYILSDQDADWDGLSNNWLTTYIEQSFQNGAGTPRVQLQDNKAINQSMGALPVNLIGRTENRSIAGCNGVSEPNVTISCFNMPPWYNDKEFMNGVRLQASPGTNYKGNWNHVEVYLQMNSIAGGIGMADGVLQYWLNGAPVLDRHDVLFRTGSRPNLQFHQFVIAPYIGDGSPADQYMWVDDLTLATGPTTPDTITPPPPPPPAVTDPAAVTNLAVTGMTDSSATLSFTEVNNGAGLPASYDVRFAPTTISWPAAQEVSLGTCATPMAGTSIGATRTCTVRGLTPATAYQFQLVSFRGTLNVDAVFGALSNIVSGTTTAPATGVASVTLSPASASVGVGATRQLTATVKNAAGTVLTGQTVTWTSSAPGVATVSSNGLVTGVANGSATITASSGGVSGTSAITITVVKPGTVSNLAVASVSNNSVTLSFTEVNAGNGKPASYEIRFAKSPLSWGSAADVASGTCTAPLAGSVIGATRTCTVTGLAASTAYQFQIVAFRGTYNVNAVFGALGNVASGTTSAATAPAPVATVSISPATVSLTAGAAQQLTATLKDAAGNTLTGRTITWTSNNGLATVSGTGLVTAVSAGSATITATSEGKSASTAVTVSTPVVTNPATVGDLAVTAVTANSATLSFTEVTDGTGFPASYQVRFSVAPLAWGSGSDVASGTCTTPVGGLAVGTKRSCTVTGLAAATQYEFELVSFRGTLNVNAVFGGLSNVAGATTAAGSVPPPVQPPPPPATGGWANEPAGFTLITDEPFNALTENGWHQAQRQTTNGSGLFVGSDANAPLSASSVLEFKYAAGYTGGSEPGVEYYDVSPVKETYFAFWWKPSAGWQNHPGSNVNKIAFMFNSSSCIYIMMYGEGGQFTLQTEPEFGGDTRRLAPNVTTTPVALGQWHKIEWYVKYSSTGSSRDGISRWWMDGVLQGDYRDVQMPADAGFSEYQLAPTWGGIGGTKSSTDYYWYDHARISRR